MHFHSVLLYSSLYFIQTRAQALLGSAAAYGVLAGSTVTNIGPSTIQGNVGVSQGSSITGFPPGIIVNGVIHAGDAQAQAAHVDALTAYNSLASGASTTDLTGQNLGGMVLDAGTYAFSSSAQLTGPLVLDAQGSANSQWIIQIGSTLTTATGSTVTLINGAQACNVFWQVGSSATVGAATQFVGSIIALTSITLDAAAINDGGLYALNGAVTLNTNDISRDVCNVGSVSSSTTSTTISTSSTVSTSSAVSTSSTILTSSTVSISSTVSTSSTILTSSTVSISSTSSTPSTSSTSSTILTSSTISTSNTLSASSSATISTSSATPLVTVSILPTSAGTSTGISASDGGSGAGNGIRPQVLIISPGSTTTTTSPSGNLSPEELLDLTSSSTILPASITLTTSLPTVTIPASATGNINGLQSQALNFRISATSNSTTSTNMSIISVVSTLISYTTFVVDFTSVPSTLFTFEQAFTINALGKATITCPYLTPTAVYATITIDCTSAPTTIATYGQTFTITHTGTSTITCTQPPSVAQSTAKSTSSIPGPFSWYSSNAITSSTCGCTTTLYNTLTETHVVTAPAITATQTAACPPQIPTSATQKSSSTTVISGVGSTNTTSIPTGVQLFTSNAPFLDVYNTRAMLILSLSLCFFFLV